MNTTTAPLWEMEALHEPSHKRRTIWGDDPYLVLRKVNEQQQIWARRWQQKLSLERRRQEQELLCRTPEEFQALALARQQELEAHIQTHSPALGRGIGRWRRLGRLGFRR